MPSSRPFALAHICNRITEKKPMSVLDIGVGFGKIGFLAREYTDVWQGRYFNWKTRIDGIEIFEKYIRQLQHEIYDNLYIGNALDILPALDNYDMIICNDVLEHFSISDGLSLLNLIKEKSRFAMIVTPINVLQQDAVYNNEHERHLCAWAENTLSEWGQVLQFENTYVLEISSAVQAKYGDTVTVNYTCRLEDGTVLATTADRDPLQLTIGEGQAIRAFERALIGMSPGEFKTTRVPANDAHGPHRKEMIQTIGREQFPRHLGPPKVGQKLQDYQPDGEIIDVMVRDVSESTVILDANHPLAGKDLTLDIQLVEISPMAMRY